MYSHVNEEKPIGLHSCSRVLQECFQATCPLTVLRGCRFLSLFRLPLSLEHLEVVGFRQVPPPENDEDGWNGAEVEKRSPARVWLRCRDKRTS